MRTSDMLETIIRIIEQNTILITAFIFIVAIIYLTRNKIKSIWMRFKTNRLLNNLGIKQRANIQWPDGLDHYFTIDRLILRHDGITLLIYKRFHGKIFCADRIDEWTQMIGRKSYKFENPLLELDHHINIISTAIPNVPVNGFIFFDHLAKFPKGQPDRVINYKNIPEQLKRDKKIKIKEGVENAWMQIIKQGTD